MRKETISYVSVFGIAILGLAFMLVPSLLMKVAYATTSTFQTTTTVTGWLFPDGTHFNNGIGALLFPFVGVAMLAGMGRVLQLEGDFGVTLILAGLTIGGLLAMLSLNASSNNVMPFGLVVIPGIDLLIWQWKGIG